MLNVLPHHLILEEVAAALALRLRELVDLLDARIPQEYARGGHSYTFQRIQLRQNATPAEHENAYQIQRSGALYVVIGLKPYGGTEDRTFCAHAGERARKAIATRRSPCHHRSAWERVVRCDARWRLGEVL